MPVHYPLTGFVRIEEITSSRNSSKRSLTPPPSKAAQRKLSSQSKTAAAPTSGKACSRWLYGVLLPGTLQLYARRTDYKRKAPPSDVIHIQVHTPSANESVFGFDHECVYIRSKDTGHVVTVRIHQKKEIVRWVTALYYQSFSSDCSSSKSADPTAMSAGKHDSKRPPELHSPSVPATDTASAAATNSEGVTTRAKRKSVSFQDEPEVLVMPRQSFDAADLFYSEREYVQFQQRGAADADDDDDDGRGASGRAPPKKNLSRLMKSIYAKTAAKLKVSHKKSSMEELR